MKIPSHFSVQIYTDLQRLEQPLAFGRRCGVGEGIDQRLMFGIAGPARQARSQLGQPSSAGGRRLARRPAMEAKSVACTGP